MRKHVLLPGLSKPLEAKAEVPLPHQFEVLTRLLACGGDPETGGSSGSLSAPVAVCLDVPFSSPSFNAGRGADAAQDLTADPFSKRAICSPSFFETHRLEAICNDPWARGNTIDSTAEQNHEPCVVPLPSFLSPEATTARARELQSYAMLETPQWAAISASEGALPDMHETAAAASRGGIERRSLSVTAAAGAAARAASAAALADAAAAAAATATAVSEKRDTVRESSGDTPGGRLFSAFRRVRHPKKTPFSVLPPPDPGDTVEPPGSRTVTLAADTEAGAVPVEEAAEEPDAPKHSFEAVPAHQMAEPDNVGFGSPELQGDGSQDQFPSKTSSGRLEGSNTRKSSVLPSHPNLMPSACGSENLFPPVCPGHAVCAIHEVYRLKHRRRSCSNELLDSCLLCQWVACAGGNPAAGASGEWQAASSFVL